MDRTRSQYANHNRQLGFVDTLPNDIREIAHCRSPIIAWTTVDPAIDICKYTYCATFGPCLFLPCFWPHLLICLPCMCLVRLSSANKIRSQFWILTETELKVVLQSHDLCCITGCNKSGDSIQTIPLENITDCGVQARQTGCGAQCVEAVPTIYVDTASATPEKLHEATGVALLGYEAFVQQVLNQRDVVKGLMRAGLSGTGSGGDGAGFLVPNAVAEVMDRGDRTATERIREITELQSNGIITQAEFDAKRKEIIDSI